MNQVDAQNPPPVLPRTGQKYAQHGGYLPRIPDFAHSCEIMDLG